MKNEGFLKINDWLLVGENEVNITYPEAISGISGVIAIAVNNKVTFFSSTIHYGPRIKDFKSAKNGKITTNVRIHSNIVKALKASKTVSLWIMDSRSPEDAKKDRDALLGTYTSPWNGRNDPLLPPLVLR